MAQKETWTVLKLLEWTAGDFKSRGIETARLDAELLLSKALGCERIDLYLRYDHTLPAEALDKHREYVRRRRDSEPVAYITGTRYFHDIKLSVSPAALIPRSETELLVDLALDKLSEVKRKHPCALDVGTGCGAIALALAHKTADLKMLATDVSPEALALAKENAERLGLADRVEWLESDMFNSVPQEARFDLLLSNPPYIPTEKIGRLMSEVRDYEPRIALDGGPEGLGLSKRLLGQASEYLLPGGWLIMEVGIGQAKELSQGTWPGLTHRQTLKDFSGINRILAFSLNPDTVS